MQFKTLSILTAATAALSAPIEARDAQQYSLQASIGPGATGLKPLQLHGNNIVYGLTQGYSDFRAEDDGDIIKLFAAGYPGLSLDVAQDGELTFKSPPEPKEGFTFKGDGNVQDLEFNGSQEFYSCADKILGPLHPQVVYVKTGDKYECENPVKFTIAATKQ
ncbi:hypothetical protein B0I72DRAFT_104925, partial [Yarrowia lipolytica]|jgi:hypothetical protein|uniref:YALI0A08195p n=2 Tax=Yarrowia lipolytica TaxID=4952 RepID=Q6CHJ4_YARLI|eukprot:XP_499867.1 YALI0A08195p [Yarrowia lipolytica CLIB122]